MRMPYSRLVPEFTFTAEHLEQLKAVVPEAFGDGKVNWEALGEYLRKTGQADERGALTTNTRADGRFHSNWLSMIYPRLRLSRGLLSEDGFLFVSIDDNEVHNLRHVLNEVFGEEALVACFVW